VCSDGLGTSEACSDETCCGFKPKVSNNATERSLGVSDGDLALDGTRTIEVYSN
jgi:hypothetical protein